MPAWLMIVRVIYWQSRSFAGVAVPSRGGVPQYAMTVSSLANLLMETVQPSV